MPKKTHLTLLQIALHFGAPVTTAVQRLGVSRPTIARILRAHGIPRWPFRSLKARYPRTVVPWDEAAARNYISSLSQPQPQPHPNPLPLPQSKSQQQDTVHYSDDTVTHVNDEVYDRLDQRSKTEEDEDYDEDEYKSENDEEDGDGESPQFTDIVDVLNACPRRADSTRPQAQPCMCVACRVVHESMDDDSDTVAPFEQLIGDALASDNGDPW